MNQTETNQIYKAGFVGLVGPTNSGKSTLLNSLVGQKVSIVSRRSQTTYHGVRGIVSHPGVQFVFTDTPGFQRHSEPVARLLNRVADRNAKECDLLVWIFDASNPRVQQQILRLREKITKLKPQDQSYCVLNKIDKIDKRRLLPLLKSVHELAIFKEVIPISARNSDGLERLTHSLKSGLPHSTPFFPEDAITDRPAQFLAAEIIREKIYKVTQQEVPYSVWVEIERWAQEPNAKCPTIQAIIHVDSPSRKVILIGKGGSMLKEIGSEARLDIEKLLGHQICLKLHVSVEPEWKRDERVLKKYLELA